MYSILWTCGIEKLPKCLSQSSSHGGTNLTCLEAGGGARPPTDPQRTIQTPTLIFFFSPVEPQIWVHLEAPARHCDDILLSTLSTTYVSYQQGRIDRSWAPLSRTPMRSSSRRLLCLLPTRARGECSFTSPPSIDRMSNRLPGRCS